MEGDEKDHWIRHRAYEIWEEEGRPEGRSNEHRRIAEQEWEEDQRERRRLIEERAHEKWQSGHEGGALVHWLRATDEISREQGERVRARAEEIWGGSKRPQEENWFRAEKEIKAADRRIRRLAYLLWERGGRPENRAKQHWKEAEKISEEEDKRKGSSN